jgi:hypothetical protein
MFVDKTWGTLKRAAEYRLALNLRLIASEI